MPQTTGPSFNARHITRSYEQTISAEILGRVYELLPGDRTKTGQILIGHEKVQPHD